MLQYLPLPVSSTTKCDENIILLIPKLLYMVGKKRRYLFNLRPYSLFNTENQNIWHTFQVLMATDITSAWETNKMGYIYLNSCCCLSEEWLQSDFNCDIQGTLNTIGVAIMWHKYIYIIIIIPLFWVVANLLNFLH